MKPPSCSVCQMTYNEEDRVPMMLQCGHSFCKECLSHMFSVSIDNTLPCPRCRQLSKVGNSVEGLRKNFAMISLLHHANENSTPEDESDEDDELNAECASNCNNLSNNGLGWPSTCGSGMVMDVGSHSMRLIRQLGKGPRPGQDSWSVLMTGPSGCRHKVAVKRIKVSEGMDLVWVQSRLENLRRASMWCQNVCTFYGACEKEGKLCMVMDKYMSSVQAEMQQNEGRLTLEQILRFICSITLTVSCQQNTSFVSLHCFLQIIICL